MPTAAPLRERYDHLRCLNKRCRMRIGLIPLSRGGAVLEIGEMQFQTTTVFVCRCGCVYLWTPARMHAGATSPMQLTKTVLQAEGRT